MRLDVLIFATLSYAVVTAFTPNVANNARFRKNFPLASLKSHDDMDSSRLPRNKRRRLRAFIGQKRKQLKKTIGIAAVASLALGQPARSTLAANAAASPHAIEKETAEVEDKKGGNIAGTIVKIGVVSVGTRLIIKRLTGSGDEGEAEVEQDSNMSNEGKMPTDEKENDMDGLSIKEAVDDAKLQENRDRIAVALERVKEAAEERTEAIKKSTLVENNVKDETNNGDSSAPDSPVSSSTSVENDVLLSVQDGNESSLDKNEDGKGDDVIEAVPKDIVAIEEEKSDEQTVVLVENEIGQMKGEISDSIILKTDDDEKTETSVEDIKEVGEERADNNAPHNEYLESLSAEAENQYDESKTFFPEADDDNSDQIVLEDEMNLSNGEGEEELSRNDKEEESDIVVEEPMREAEVRKEEDDGLMTVAEETKSNIINESEFTEEELMVISDTAFQCHGFFPDFRTENELPKEIRRMREHKSVEEVAIIKAKYDDIEDESERVYRMLVDLGLMENYDELEDYSEGENYDE